MKYMYKCRFCGTSFANNYEPDVDKALELLGKSIVKLNGHPEGGRFIPLYTKHSCGGDMVGVADLIGICDDQEAEE